MKKWFLIAAAALLAVSCKLENAFTQTNAMEFLNIRNGSIQNDNSILYTVTSDITDHKWTDCSRIYALFDMTGDNSAGTGYNIELKAYEPVSIVTPEDPSEEDGIGDPVKIGDSGISGGYLNLILGWQTLAKSTAQHSIRVTYEDDALTGFLRLTIIHDADGESEADIHDDENPTAYGYFSIPIYDLFPAGSSRTLELTVAYYDSSDEEEPVKQSSVTLYTSVRF